MIGPAKTSRRHFVQRTAVLTGGAVAAPAVIPSGILAAPRKGGASNRIGIGWIGAGRRAHQMIHDLKKLPGGPGQCEIVAVSDVWPEKCKEYLNRYEAEVIHKKGRKYGIYRDYRNLLDNNNVDAVVLTTPEHSRALPCIHACQAGKDIYAEKPLSLTVREGRAMVEAVRKYRRVFQTGTQQRSHFRNRQASEYVRNGRIGKLQTVICQNWVSSRPFRDYELPTEPVPKGLDWNMWCGQTEPLPFSMQIYLTYNNPGWHNLRRYSGGWMTNAGSHALDMVQWALDTDDTGPVEVWAEGKSFDAKVTYRYANGVLLKLEQSCSGPGIPAWKSNQKSEDEASRFGAIFIGDEGKLIEHRGRFNTKPIAISKQPIRDTDIRLYKSDDHFQNFIDCIKSREKCIADVETGHRSCTVCHLGNIARRTGRRLRWDPENETFPGDDEANSYLARPQRAPYQLPNPV